MIATVILPVVIRRGTASSLACVLGIPAQPRRVASWVSCRLAPSTGAAEIHRARLSRVPTKWCETQGIATERSEACLEGRYHVHDFMVGKTGFACLCWGQKSLVLFALQVVPVHPVYLCGACQQHLHQGGLGGVGDWNLCLPPTMGGDETTGIVLTF